MGIPSLSRTAPSRFRSHSTVVRVNSGEERPYLVDDADHSVDYAGVDRGAVEEGWLGCQHRDIHWCREHTSVSLTTSDQVGGCPVRSADNCIRKAHLAYNMPVLLFEIVE